MFERFIIDRILHVWEIYYRLDSLWIDWILLEIIFIMVWIHYGFIMDSLWIDWFIIDRILHVREIYYRSDCILFITSLGIHVYHPCLFIALYPYSTRLRRLLRRSIPTALTPRYLLSIFIRRRLLSLPITVSGLHRWAEIAHITTFDSFSLLLLKHFSLYYIMTSSSLWRHISLFSHFYHDIASFTLL